MIRRIFLLLQALIVLFLISGQDELKSSLSRRLQTLQQKDSLYEWLYACMQYAEEAQQPLPSLRTARESIWREARSDSERVALIYFLSTLGYYEMYSGNILGSINAFEEAFSRYNAQPVKEADINDFVLKPLGNNYTRLGDYDQALYIQQRSLELVKQGSDSAGMASTLNNMAISARWKGELDSARKYALEGIAVVDKDTSLYGLMLSTLADIFFEEGRYAEAEQQAGEAVHVLRRKINEKKSNAAYWLLSAYLVQGNILKERSQFKEALKTFQHALGILRDYFPQGRPREKAKAFVAIGQACEGLNNYSTALAMYDSSLAALGRKIYPENTFLDAISGKAGCLKALGRPEEALTSYQQLFEVEKKLRNEFFSEAARQQHQRNNREWIESAMATAWELWERKRDTVYVNQLLLFSELSKAQLLLDELQKNLAFNQQKTADTMLKKQATLYQAIAYHEREAALGNNSNENLRRKTELEYELSLLQKKINEKYKMDLQGTATPDPGQLIASIPGGMMVLEYFTGRDHIYALRLDNKGIRQAERTGDADSLGQMIKEFVNSYFQSGPGNLINKPAEYYQGAYKIYETLCKGLEGQRECMVIPDGILGYLPFGALVTDSAYNTDPAAWPFLIKRTNIFHGYSLQTWQRQRQRNKGMKKFTGFFISFDSSQVSIPAVKKEYRLIKNEVKGKFYADKKANLENFENSLDEGGILHISTHSFLQGKQQVPVLQFADKPFFLFELYGKTFEPGLVVLSACRTGNGLLAEGEGVISLARGFTASGAGGIIAALWNVNDESTAELVSGFYAHLTEKAIPSRALHAAQLDWLNRAGPPQQKLPYFWAGLIYAGNDLPVRIKQKDQQLKLLTLIAGGIILLAGVFFLTRVRKKNGT